MNYHTDNWIMEQVSAHYEAAKNVLNKPMVGIFYQGSGNYGLDYEDSDVDTKVVTLPEFNELVFNLDKINFTHILNNDEHIEFKDIRLMFSCFEKQNLNYLEILWTPYKIFNHYNWELLWQPLIDKKEFIGHSNSDSHIKSIYGIASEKYHALEHHYPSRMKWIDKFGYDPKQLHHLLRLREYLNKYIHDYSCEDCYKSSDAEYLISVKKGLYNLEDARKIADDAMSEITNIFKLKAKKENYANVDNRVKDLLNDILWNFISSSVYDESESW